MSKKLTVALGTAFLITSVAVAENLYLETFEDGDLIDGTPVSWAEFPGFNAGTSSVVDGDLVAKRLRHRLDNDLSHGLLPGDSLADLSPHVEQVSTDKEREDQRRDHEEESPGELERQ